MQSKYSAVLFLYLELLLAGCVESPAKTMTPQQISSLSNTQLCELSNNYEWDQNTEIEIGKRDLICDPAYIECSNQGHALGTPAMALCMDQLRENWALQEQVQEQQEELARQRQQAESQHQWDRIIENSRQRCINRQVPTPHGMIVDRQCW